MVLPVDLYTVQLAGCVKAAVVNNFTVAKVQRGNGVHLFFAQRKTKNIEIFYHSLLADGFGDGGNSPLIMPAQNHLGNRFFMAGRNFYQGFLFKDVFLCFRQRPQACGTTP